METKYPGRSWRYASANSLGVRHPEQTQEMLAIKRIRFYCCRAHNSKRAHSINAPAKLVGLYRRVIWTQRHSWTVGWRTHLIRKVLCETTVKSLRTIGIIFSNNEMVAECTHLRQADYVVASCGGIKWANTLTSLWTWLWLTKATAKQSCCSAVRP